MPWSACINYITVDFMVCETVLFFFYVGFIVVLILFIITFVSEMKVYGLLGNDKKKGTCTMRNARYCHHYFFRLYSTRLL